jgi:hypothetical protein
MAAPKNRAESQAILYINRPPPVGRGRRPRLVIPVQHSEKQSLKKPMCGFCDWLAHAAAAHCWLMANRHQPFPIFWIEQKPSKNCPFYSYSVQLWYEEFFV